MCRPHTRQCLVGRGVFQPAQEDATGGDDGGVRGAEVFLGPIDDRSHALLHRMVLIVDAVDAAVRFAFLHVAVDHPIDVAIAQLAMVIDDLAGRPPAAPFKAFAFGIGQRIVAILGDPVIDHTSTEPSQDRLGPTPETIATDVETGDSAAIEDASKRNRSPSGLTETSPSDLVPSSR